MVGTCRRWSCSSAAARPPPTPPPTTGRRSARHGPSARASGPTASAAPLLGVLPAALRRRRALLGVRAAAGVPKDLPTVLGLTFESVCAGPPRQCQRQHRRQPTRQPPAAAAEVPIPYSVAPRDPPAVRK